MDDHATLRGMLPTGQSKINLKIEVTAEINVSAFVARQKSNRFLITQAGDQLCAGDPELAIGPKVSWRVPVQYAPSRRGLLGIVGHLMVDADNGEVTIADGHTIEDLLKLAETLHERSSLSAGA